MISSVHKVDLLKTKLWVEFDGEEVLDYGKKMNNRYSK